MSNLTPLQAPRPAAAAAPAAGPARTAVAVHDPGRGVVPALPAAALPNPSLRLDASLGLVVLEFRASDGEARTIPSERELEAYRSAARGATTAPASPVPAPSMPVFSAPESPAPAADAAASPALAASSSPPASAAAEPQGRPTPAVDQG